jgi:antitoxin YefM
LGGEGWRAFGGPLSNFVDMNAVSYSQAPANLNAMIDKVVADRAPSAITCQRGKGAMTVSLFSPAL